jgi:hypothetical protein
MSTSSIYRRIARRETHSPRSVLAIILAVIVILAAAWFGTEIVLSLLSQPALLVAPTDAEQAIITVAALPVGVLLAAGIILAVIGLVLLIAAVTAGRRARHVIQTDRAVTVIDNRVIASALARHASYAGNTNPDSTRVDVSHRRAVVHITPTSGTAADKDAIKTAVDEQLDSYGAKSSLRSKISLRTGKVGA